MTRQTVDAYFARLGRELSDLPPQQRSEILAEIRDHVDQALASEPSPSEADVRNVLERLGDPADIAQEARQRSGVRRATPSWTDWWAVFLLPFGGLLALVLGLLGALGWVVGAIFLLTSRVWSTRDKAIGLLLFPGGLLLPLVLLLSGGAVCTSSPGAGGRTVTSCSGFTLPPILGIPLLIVLVLTPLVTAVFLGSRLRARTDQSP